MRKYKGIFLIILASLFSALMGLFVNLAGDLPSMQKSFIRNAVALLIAFSIHKGKGVGFKVPKRSIPTLLVRLLAGSLGLMASFYSMDKLPLSDWTMIGKMAPFFTLLFSALLLKEKMNLVQKICFAASAIGSLFILKPTFANILLVPSLMCFADAILSGIAYTFVRKLGLQRVPGTLIVFYFSLSCTIATLPFAIFNYHPMTTHQVVMMLLAATSGTFTQFCLTAAYRCAPAKEISVYEYSQVIFAAIFGFLFLSQIPDMLSIAGYAVIFSSALVMFLFKRKEEMQKN